LTAFYKKDKKDELVLSFRPSFWQGHNMGFQN